MRTEEKKIKFDEKSHFSSSDSYQLVEEMSLKLVFENDDFYLDSFSFNISEVPSSKVELRRLLEFYFPYEIKRQLFYFGEVSEFHKNKLQEDSLATIQTLEAQLEFEKFLENKKSTVYFSSEPDDEKFLAIYLVKAAKVVVQTKQTKQLKPKTYKVEETSALSFFFGDSFLSEDFSFPIPAVPSSKEELLGWIQLYLPYEETRQITSWKKYKDSHYGHLVDLVREEFSQRFIEAAKEETVRICELVQDLNFDDFLEQRRANFSHPGILNDEKATSTDPDDVFFLLLETQFQIVEE